MYLNLGTDDLMVLVSALNCYMETLQERERANDYWFRNHVLADRKQMSEDNKVALQSRMVKVDVLRQMMLGALPASTLRD